MASSLIQPVILSGGSGTRLWPLSTPEKPKQLLPVVGERTMLELTLARIIDETRYAAPIIVCGAAHADEVRTQLTAAGLVGARLIVEPAAQNTAPAIALAAMSVAPETVLLVMPSDHVILDLDSFQRAVDTAHAAAQAGWLVTFGIEANKPETGYGYIQPDEELTDGVRRVAAFVEKPSCDTAQLYIEEGYSWNAGIFLFRAEVFNRALSTHSPAVLDSARRAIEGAQRNGFMIHPDEKAFASAPNISIDHAVLEKTDRVAVIPVSMGWSDVGSWDAFHEIQAKDAAGNVVSGEVLAIDVEDSLIVSDGAIIAAVGVRNLVIVASRGRILVLPRGEGQRVKEVSERLAKPSRKCDSRAS